MLEYPSLYKSCNLLSRFKMAAISLRLVSRFQVISAERILKRRQVCIIVIQHNNRENRGDIQPFEIVAISHCCRFSDFTL